MLGCSLAIVEPALYGVEWAFSILWLVLHQAQVTPEPVGLDLLVFTAPYY